MIRTCLSIVWFLGASLLAASAFAQSEVDSPNGPKMIPVVTVTGPGADESPAYWWETPADPAWTPFDRTLLEKLSEQGIPTVDFTDPPRISRIYQRPTLSLQNAAALCSLLEVRRLLHGVVDVTVHTPGPVERTTFAKATAELKLVDTGARAPTVLQEVSIERSAAAPSLREAVERVQARAAEAAVSVVGRIARRSGGRMSIEREEPLIGIWGARKAESVNRLRELMASADGVDEVALTWAAEGVVGFEINPGRQDSTKTIEYVARVVLKERLDQIRVRRREKEVSGMVSLEVSGESSASGSTPHE